MHAAPILVVRLSSLGDVILSSSFLQSCREHFPASRIDFVVREDLLPVASALPEVQRVIAVRREAKLPTLLALGARLAREGYAHVFDLHQSARSRLLTWRLRRHVRRGFSKQGLPRWILLRFHRDLYDRFGGGLPLRERMLEPLRRLGYDSSVHDTQLVVPMPARARAATILADIAPQETCVGVAPGARWSAKRWPVERWAALVAELARTPQRRFILLGDASEKSLSGPIVAAAPGRCIDLVGELDILECAAVLERCCAALGHDSALMHAAEAVGRPVLTFFGPTTPRFGYAPYRTQSRVLHRPPPCNPCSKNGSRPCVRPTHECMENIDAPTAFAAASELLDHVADNALEPTL
jgi:lipopolysaccharide heptosyltransferase II